MANKLEFNEVQVSVGDMVKVHFGEGNPFDGIVIGIKGEAENRSFTVRETTLCHFKKKYHGIHG